MVPRVSLVESLSLHAIQLDPQNPRVHSKRQVRQIARSIQTFGFNVPVLVNAEGRLIAGHGRVLAAKLLGLSEIPAIRVQHLTEAQSRAFMIADNRLTENSVWDDRLLAEQFQVLSALNLDFNIEVTGFEVAEVDASLESLMPARRGERPSPNLLWGREKRFWILHADERSSGRYGLHGSSLQRSYRWVRYWVREAPSPRVQNGFW